MSWPLLILPQSNFSPPVISEFPVGDCGFRRLGSGARIGRKVVVPVGGATLGTDVTSRGDSPVRRFIWPLAIWAHLATDVLTFLLKPMRWRLAGLTLMSLLSESESDSVLVSRL